MAKNKKKAKQKHNPKINKIAKNKKNPDSFMDKNISWHFSKIDLNKNSDWSWKTFLALDHNNKLFKKLCDYEKMKLSQVQDRKNHRVGLDSLNKKAVEELEKNNLDDIGNLHSFHVNATTRFYCIPFGNIMKLLWYDPYHSYDTAEKAVCPPHR